LTEGPTAESGLQRNRFFSAAWPVGCFSALLSPHVLIEGMVEKQG